MNNIKMDTKKTIRKGISRGLQWENKPSKLKRSFKKTTELLIDPNIEAFISISSCDS